MCYLEGSKLSKKYTFKFVLIRNGIEGLAATCVLEKKISYCLSNSFGFGGTNASLVFKHL